VIQLQACLQRFAAVEDDIQLRNGKASKSSRIGSMPKYLFVQLQRYYINEKWIPSKLDCKVPMPQTLSLEELRGKGLQEGETPLPEESKEASSAAAASPTPDPMIVSALLEMGITENAAARACLAVGNANADAATAWFFEHAEDPDVNDPPPAAGGAPAAGADPEQIAMITSMGFTEKQAAGALKACSNNAERAVDWIFSHADDLDAAIAALEKGGEGSSKKAKEYDDGPGEYEIVGFISHIGKNTSSGHYVCHMKRSDGWVIFDDQKVARSESPPFELGYLYLYRRKGAS
jgi:ubiquitin carboxyl-terminal hydrolase 5/13